MRGGVAAGVFVVAILSGASALAAPSGWLALDASIRATGGAVDWANSGAAGGTPCTNGGVDVTGSGGLFNCGIYNGATTPPTPPLRTNNDPTIISTAFIADPLPSDVTQACGAGDPTTVQGGTNDDALNSYTITTGSSPPKDELANVYAVSRTRADGHPELYFAAERATNNGNSHIDFEFLQSVVTRTAACGGTLTGNRTQGDLLVAADFSNGGQVATASVWQWQCSPVQPNGTICDPGTGAQYVQNLSLPAGTIPFFINDTAAVPCGGWACRAQNGAQVTDVPQFDFVEGGISLQDLGFTGCFTTFLPHTRTSDSFTSQLADFTGPHALASCRTPVTNSTPGGSVAPGTAVRDVADLTNDGAAVKPGGTLTFFLCQPAQVTASGCLGGTQVGAPKSLVNGVATSDPSSATNTSGKYCWRTVYTPDLASLGIYTPGSHTNATTECFNVAAPVNLPNTGLPDIRFNLWSSLPGLLIAPALLLSLAWRRSRSLAVLLMAGVIVGSSPPIAPAPPPTGRDPGVAQSSAHVDEGATSTQLGGVKAKAMGWRLVIPRIGVDALIQSVGRDSHGAMASPSGLDTVAWFNRGPVPGHPGDAVIDGHYGDSSQAGVFRKLHWLRPGDEIQVVWPDGRTVFFEVATSEVVAANAHPAGVFARTGPARISLITCTGLWDQSRRTYSDRLIVTAMLS